MCEFVQKIQQRQFICVLICYNTNQDNWFLTHGLKKDKHRYTQLSQLLSVSNNYQKKILK